MLSIREIEDGDIDAVVALWDVAGVSRPWNDPYRDIAFARQGAHSTVLVGLEDHRIVATVMVGEDGHRGWAYYLAVEPSRQGAGLGREIMTAAEAWLARRGVWKAQLLIRQENREVRAVYERLGYRDTETICLQKIIEPQDH